MRKRIVRTAAKQLDQIYRVIFKPSVIIPDIDPE